MAYEVIQLIKENGVATITLNRPPMNPLNGRVFQELADAADEIEADNAVRAVVITGSGDRAFAAGADISEMVNLTPMEIHAFCRASRTAFTKIENLSKPVIAAVNGLALGGGTELALTCDFRLAADTAKFGQPEINLGIIPGGGGTQRLSRLIGIAKAKELILLGDIIDAATAEKLCLGQQGPPGGFSHGRGVQACLQAGRQTLRGGKDGQGGHKYRNQRGHQVGAHPRDRQLHHGFFQ